MPVLPTKEIFALRVGDSDNEPVLPLRVFDHFLGQTFSSSCFLTVSLTVAAIVVGIIFDVTVPNF